MLTQTPLTTNSFTIHSGPNSLFTNHGWSLDVDREYLSQFLSSVQINYIDTCIDKFNNIFYQPKEKWWRFLAMALLFLATVALILYLVNYLNEQQHPNYNIKFSCENSKKSHYKLRFYYPIISQSIVNPYQFSLPYQQQQQYNPPNSNITTPLLIV
ncbi:hypothetical protein DLAC_04328 [Tieghemostelium lacteum]|uniref:Transmembrane protein n=1 Tax=Tieghemostelium lacteum TaxID=361077 RepID=A0A151ZJG6_TIELA|nr:hypothetical protein DLAC_04328 [Tieghemostelium lacteum]|eukprot:KYQ94055.1 hypothetical protein DLAC_04328 [Tieghemostelium lacteum]